MKLMTVPVSCAVALGFALISQAPFNIAHDQSFAPAAFAQDVKKELPPCLAEIAKATVIEDSSLPSAKLKESLLAAQKLGPKAKDLLVEIAQTGTPAGRLISLALLKKIDIGQYQKLASALKQELGDQPVSYRSPAEHCHYSVADILNDMAASKSVIKILPVAASRQ